MKLRNLAVLAVIACSTLVACSEDTLSVRRQMLEQTNVAAHFDNWVRSVSNMDRDSVAAMYHQVPELRVLYPNGRMSRGWEEERAVQDSFFDRVELVNFVTSGIEVEILSAGFASTTFRYSFDVVVDGEQLSAPVEGVATISWIKDSDDDRWKIHTQHASVPVPFDE